MDNPIWKKADFSGLANKLEKIRDSFSKLIEIQIKEDYNKIEKLVKIMEKCNELEKERHNNTN